MDLQNYFNAQKAQQSLDLQADSNEIALLGNDLLEQIKEAFLDNYKVSVETAETQEESAKSLTSLTDGVKELVSNEQENASNLEASLANLTDATTKSMASNKSEGLVSHLKNTGSILKQMAKLAAKEYVQNTKYGKLWTNISKEMKKQGAAKTKVIEGKKGEEGGGGGGGDVPPLDSKLIAASMAMAAFKALNPVTMVMTFLTKVVPMLIVFGLLLYGFIKGYFNTSVEAAIAGVVAFIIAAAGAYFAWKIAKEAVYLAFKFAMMIVQTVASVAADWAEFALVAAAVAVVAAAFILVSVVLIAAVLLIGVMIAVALAAIVVALAKALLEVVKVIVDGIVYAIKAFAEIAPMLGKIITDMMHTAIEVLTEAITFIPKAILSLVVGGIDAIMGAITSIVDSIGNVVATVLKAIGSAAGGFIKGLFGFGKKEEPKKEITEDELKELSIKALTANFEVGGVFATLVAEGFIKAFENIIEPVKTAMETVATNFDAAYQGTMSKISSLFTDVSKTISSQTKLLIAGMLNDLNVITGAYLSILFGMPLVGWLMGLVGSNSFTKALEPLVENSRQIAALIADVLQAVSMKQNGIAKSTAITNTVTNAETSVIESGINTIVPTDTEGVNEETTTLKGVPSNFVTAQAFSLQMAAVRASMKDVVDAIYKTAPKDSKDKGLFSWW